MNETPAPLSVSAISSFGRLAGVAASASSASASAPTSLPSQRPTAQPNARTLASRSPRSLTSATHVSDWILLWSTIAVISSKPRWRPAERLPELALLELAVAGQHVHARRRAPAQPVGAHEPLRLRDAHPERAVLVTTSGVAARRGGRAGRPAGAAGGSGRSRAGRAPISTA